MNKRVEKAAMPLLGKTLRIIIGVTLAIVLGTASVARASHEAQAPSHVFLSDDDGGLTQAGCFSLHVTESGAPVKPVHIHACGFCLSVFAEIVEPSPPDTIFHRLQPPRRLLFYPPPVPVMTRVMAEPSNTPRAPPIFS